MNFRVRWQDIVKRPGDCATNGVCTIRQIDQAMWHIYTNDYRQDNHLSVRTVEGVDMTLEEQRVKDEGWQKL